MRRVSCRVCGRAAGAGTRAGTGTGTETDTETDTETGIHIKFINQSRSQKKEHTNTRTHTHAHHSTHTHTHAHAHARAPPKGLFLTCPSASDHTEFHCRTTSVHPTKRNSVDISKRPANIATDFESVISSTEDSSNPAMAFFLPAM